MARKTMTTKLFLDIQDSAFLRRGDTNAISKPRLDAQHIATTEGYRSVIANGNFSLEGVVCTDIWRRIQKKWRRWMFSLSLLKFRTIPSGSDILVQYPFLSPRMYDVLSVLKAKGCRISVLFHDFYTLREQRQNDTAELSLLQLADIVIAHSESMAQSMREHNCNAEMRLLHCFDYLLPEIHVNRTDAIIYAGNLSKSGFVRKLRDVTGNFNLYGLPSVEDVSNVHYKGVFSSNAPEGLEGSWGLVWDGDSTDSCDGLNGEYLRYNAPFKLSLYLALGIPVIVWEQSAASTFVRSRHLGICINSLHEISEQIASLSEEEKSLIHKSVTELSHSIRTGQMLRQCLA